MLLFGPAEEAVFGLSSTLELKDLALAAIDDRKGVDAVALPVSTLTDVADYMVIASGTSNRHVRAIVAHLLQVVKERGHAVMGVEGREQNDWVLVDLLDVIVHVMRKETRAFYDLERLWEALEPAASAPADAPITASASV